jgi:Protein of unknown function (DUF2612)
MINTIETYQNLITSQFQEQPDYQAVISLSVSTYVQIQDVLNSMIPIFDLSLDPIGDQLDIIGQWVGVSRDIKNPFSNIFFEWDGTQFQGWDYGIWQSSGNPSAIVVLPDDVYLLLIKAKIASNSWDGTTEGAYAAWNIIFPNLTLLYLDYQNMSFAVAVVGTIPDSLTLALLTGGYLTLRPEGVEISEYFIPTTSNPMFAWDLDTPTLKGWDSGYWAQEIFP